MRRPDLTVAVSLVVLEAGLLIWLLRQGAPESLIGLPLVGLVVAAVGAIGLITGALAWGRQGPAGDREGEERASR